MIKTLYKNSHLIAAAIILGVTSLVTIGSAAAMSATSASEASVPSKVADAKAMPTLGRFVVGPQHAVFVPTEKH